MGHKIIKIDHKIIFFKYILKRERAIAAYGDTEIEKRKFHCPKNPILIDYADIIEVILSDRVSLSKKIF